jgi:hypothetical protein
VTVDAAVLRSWATAAGDRYPYSEWRPLPENSTQPHINPTQLIFHTQASGGQASNDAGWRYWNRPDIKIEAHFLLDMDGAMVQAVGIFTRADNNADANNRAVSIETQDLGGRSVETTPWTGAQIEQLAGLTAWLHLHPKIRLPLKQCQAWNGPGYGPHNLFAQWSVYKGKTCPGRARTAQIPEVIAAAQRYVNIAEQHFGGAAEGPFAPASREDDMPIHILRSMTDPPEFNAQFIAYCDTAGHSIEVQWSGSGDDPRVAQRMADLRAAGITETHITLAGLRNNVLHARYRPGDITDSLHDWTPEDFA